MARTFLWKFSVELKICLLLDCEGLKPRGAHRVGKEFGVWNKLNTVATFHLMACCEVALYLLALWGRWGPEKTLNHMAYASRFVN